jgi:hypothetical protein
MLLQLGGQESLKTIREHYAIAHELQQKLYHKNPSNQEMRRRLSGSHYRLGAVARRLGEGSEAETQFHECLKLRELLAREDHENMYKQVELVIAQACCGDHVKAADAAGRFRAAVAKDASILYYVGCVYALCVAAVGNDPDKKQLTPEERSLREQYAKEAIATIRQAIAQGYHDLVSVEFPALAFSCLDSRPLRRASALNDD